MFGSLTLTSMISLQQHSNHSIPSHSLLLLAFQCFYLFFHFTLNLMLECYRLMIVRLRNGNKRIFEGFNNYVELHIKVTIKLIFIWMQNEHLVCFTSSSCSIINIITCQENHHYFARYFRYHESFDFFPSTEFNWFPIRIHQFEFSFHHSHEMERQKKNSKWNIGKR